MNEPHTQSYSQFVEKAIVLVVIPTMDQGKLRMLPNNAESEKALETLHGDLMELAPKDLNRPKQMAWVSERIDRLLERGFAEDLWYGSLPGNRTVVLIKDAAAQQYGSERALRRVHSTEVIEAARSGAFIPNEVAAEYESELMKIRQPSPASHS
jgi:hypothetical protein